MFEDDTSGCHSPTVSCRPAVTFNCQRPASLSPPRPLTVFVGKRPMKSLQNDDCDRKQRSPAGRSYVPSFHGNDAGCFVGFVFLNWRVATLCAPHKGHLGDSMPVGLSPCLTRLVRITVVFKASAVTAIVHKHTRPGDAGCIKMIECSCCWESLQKQPDTNLPHAKRTAVPSSTASASSCHMSCQPGHLAGRGRVSAYDRCLPLTSAAAWGHDRWMGTRSLSSTLTRARRMSPLPREADRRCFGVLASAPRFKAARLRAP